MRDLCWICLAVTQENTGWLHTYQNLSKKHDNTLIFICFFDVFFFPCFCVSLCLPPATIQWIGLWQAHRAQEVDRPLIFLMGNPWKFPKKYGNLCGKDVERMWTLRSQAWINLDEVWRPSAGNRKGWWLERVTNDWSMMLIYTPDIVQRVLHGFTTISPTISPIV